jgi:predicted nucleic acid-binding protein
VLNVEALVARARGHKVYLDTHIFIYVLNDTPLLAGPSLNLLQACADRHLLGLTGDATLAELLVKPLQRNDAAAVAAVRALLLDDGAITLVPHDRPCFERAAHLRATHGLKMVDALHLATAIQAGASCFISNDQRFPASGLLECLSLG